MSILWRDSPARALRRLNTLRKHNMCRQSGACRSVCRFSRRLVTPSSSDQCRPGACYRSQYTRCRRKRGGPCFFHRPAQHFLLRRERLRTHFAGLGCAGDYGPADKIDVGSGYGCSSRRRQWHFRLSLSCVSWVFWPSCSQMARTWRVRRWEVL